MHTPGTCDSVSRAVEEEVKERSECRKRHQGPASSVSLFSTTSHIVLDVVAKHMAPQRLLES